MANEEGETLETTLNETIKMLMVRTGRRQVDVAEVVGITRGSLSQRLLGNSGWRVNDLPPVADYFGLTVGELLSGYASIATAKRLPPAAKSSGQTSI
ncbi:helix-turn-helix transcriptional regulator [Streptomyces sp. NPDC050392]|uniref:helix-turn-helix transcriptional regulator n=1 Tax=Streptomyces sp. NPDC050392 TaxID=3155782 RepID=UPI0034387944